jgi:hypothetical protein
MRFFGASIGILVLFALGASCGPEDDPAPGLQKISGPAPVVAPRTREGAVETRIYEVEARPEVLEKEGGRNPRRRLAARIVKDLTSLDSPTFAGLDVSVLKEGRFAVRGANLGDHPLLGLDARITSIGTVQCVDGFDAIAAPRTATLKAALARFCAQFFPQRGPQVRHYMLDLWGKSVAKRTGERPRFECLYSVPEVPDSRKKPEPPKTEASENDDVTNHLSVIPKLPFQLDRNAHLIGPTPERLRTWHKAQNDEIRDLPDSKWVVLDALHSMDSDKVLGENWLWIEGVQTMRRERTEWPQMKVKGTSLNWGFDKKGRERLQAFSKVRTSRSIHLMIHGRIWLQATIRGSMDAIALTAWDTNEKHGFIADCISIARYGVRVKRVE